MVTDTLKGMELIDRNYLSSSALLGTGREIIPDIRGKNGSIIGCFNSNSPYHLDRSETLLLDWGRKRTGWIKLAGKGTVHYSLASDLKILDLFDSRQAKSDSFRGDCFPSFCAGKAKGTIELPQEPTLLQSRSNAFRYLRLTNKSDSAVLLKTALLKPSEFPAQPVGSFECSDDEINTGWRMGIDTLHLCTQPAEESLAPVFAPFGEGFVQWDGCRRDREIWGGDLRPGALGWYYNFADQSPIANSLYILMSAQHCDCNEVGLFPGSGSTHQTYYEWAFWEVVCLWEYILHTADEKLIRFAAHVVPIFLQWCERKFAENPDGWIYSSNNWMYTIQFEKQPLPSLQAVAVIGLNAMEKLFLHLRLTEQANKAKSLRRNIVDRFHSSFWDAGLRAYRFTVPEKGERAHSDLGANCWAILADIVKPEKRKTVLESLKRLHWTKAGSINIFPTLAGCNSHNNNIWPYANACEMTARFYAGDVDGGLTLFKRYVNRIASIGHNTMFEMIHIDGSLPIQEDGDTLSFCHAWGALGSWALQRYILGVAPVKLGWKEFSFAPLGSPLEWVKGSVVTPYGNIDVELESSNDKLKGKVVHPRRAKCLDTAEWGKKVEFISK